MGIVAATLKKICIILLIGFPCLIRGQSVGLSQSVALNGIAHVAFRVTNVEQTADFYKKLGFEQAFAFSKGGSVSQAFIKINDRQFVELYPEVPGHTATGFMHLCFEAPDLVALNHEYVERGLVPSKVKKAGAGNLLFTLAGPEDQNIEYTQYMPGSLHENDISKHLGPHRISDRLLSVTLAMDDAAKAEAFYTQYLAFRPAVSQHESVLFLPGDSGESIAFKPLNKLQLPDITFQVANVRRAIRDLKQRGFTVRATKHDAYVTDPDGMVLGFSSQSSNTPRP